MALALKRLPYLKETSFNIVLSGGVADAWAPLLVDAAKSRGLNVTVIKLPGSLSTHAHVQNTVPDFPPEVAELLKKRPTVFFDDTYSNGGTAQRIRTAVRAAGGEVDGVFVAYDGGRGDPAALYKSARKSLRDPSMGQFPKRPDGWKWSGKPVRLGIELGGTLTLGAYGRLTPQGEALLKALDAMHAEVQLMDYGAPVSPDRMREIASRFPNLKLLGSAEKVDAMLGNWGKKFVGKEEQRPFARLTNPIHTIRIDSVRNNGTFDTGSLSPDYLIDRLVDAGVVTPVFNHPPRTEVAHSGVVDLRQKPEEAPKPTVEVVAIEPKEPKPGEQAQPAAPATPDMATLLADKDSKKRVQALKSLSWKQLSPEEQEQVIQHAKGVSNSYEHAALIRLAAESKDKRWVPILRKWVDDWAGIRGWQYHVRRDALDVLNLLESP